MLRGDFYQAEEEEDYNMRLQDQYDEDEDDEALSFCDLPIYYGGNEQENESADGSSRWNQSLSSNSFSSTNYNEDENDDDCFEFSFSSSQSLEEKNIVFCGKIIPYRKEEALPRMNSAYYYYSKDELQVLKCNNNKSTKSSTPKAKGKPLTMEKKKTCHASKNNKSSKWYLLMLGLVRIQGGNMELKDIKKRQTKRSHRRHSSSNTSGNINKEIGNYNAAGDDEMMMMKKAAAGNNNNNNNNNNNKAGLLSLLRSFSCTSSSSPATHDCKVKASLWCLQQLRTPR